MRKRNIVKKIVIISLIVLILVFSVGIIYRFTNEFNEEFKTFYLEYDKNEILAEETSMSLHDEKLHRFDVKYTFDFVDKEPRNYSVKIVPNGDVNFDFTADGKTYSWLKVKDLTAVFDISIYDTYFDFYIPNGMNLQRILESLYPGKTIEFPKEIEKEKPYLYTLVVSSYNETIVYNIDFTICVIKEVDLSRDEIVM